MSLARCLFYFFSFLIYVIYVEKGEEFTCFYYDYVANHDDWYAAKKERSSWWKVALFDEQDAEEFTISMIQKIRLFH